MNKKKSNKIAGKDELSPTVKSLRGAFRHSDYRSTREIISEILLEKYLGDKNRKERF